MEDKAKKKTFIDLAKDLNAYTQHVSDKQQQHSLAGNRFWLFIYPSAHAWFFPIFLLFLVMLHCVFFLLCFYTTNGVMGVK